MGWNCQNCALFCICAYNKTKEAYIAILNSFLIQYGGKQAALHALGNISGETRNEGSILLNDAAEECLRRLIYEVAARTSKLTPSVS